MNQITRPVVAITLVLISVFLPTLVIPGVSGQLLRQFGATISIAVGISAVNALTLSPALCALWLKHPHWGPSHARSCLDRGSAARLWRHAPTPAACAHTGCCPGAVVGIALWPLSQRLRTSFLPEEDKGAFFIAAQLPNGASLSRTREVVEQIEGMLRPIDAVQDTFSVLGYSLLNGTQESNAAFVFVRLRPFGDRRDQSEQARALIERIWRESQQIRSAIVIPFNLPAIVGLSTTGGFDYELEALDGQRPDELAKTTQALIAAAGADKRLIRLFSSYNASTPFVSLDIDRGKAQALGVGLNDVFTALQATLGGIYVNDFNASGRTWQVNVQGKPGDRADLDALSRIYLRNTNGDEVALQSIATAHIRVGPQTISRYNNRRAVAISGSPAAGVSSGDALQAMEAVSRSTLGPGYMFEWTGTAYLEKAASGAAWLVFGVATACTYLFLVALFESFMLPVAVLMSVVIGVFGSLASLSVAGLSFDIYAELGLLILVGMIAKNGILIIDFACTQRLAGASIVAAAAAAAKARFRAVAMTSAAFILGLVPLVTASGVAQLSRHTVGLSIMTGMTAATVIGVFVTPLLYVSCQRLRERIKARFFTPALST